MAISTLSMLAFIGVISLACQWAAWRVRIPAILPLLLSGLLMGPGLGILDPDALFGELLFPIVSLSVAVILFEGALTLDMREIRGHGAMVRNLVSVGMLITWGIISAASHLLMDLSWPIAALFGALVVVTGPTVIVPLLRAARPSAKLANILRWEGIIIDPIGALLAVLVYEFVVSSQEAALAHTLQTFFVTLLIGFILGWIAARLTEKVMLNHWLPHYLQNPAMLCFMLGVYALSNELAHESGLLTVTVMGMILANRHHLDMEPIHEFKETLSVLLISALFILLAARIQIEQITELGWPAVILLLVILVVARPVCVWLSAVGTDLNWREKLLLSWVSPRGIVAAAVSGLFALKLEQLGWHEGAILVPMVFMVIIATVVLQSLSTGGLTRALGLQEQRADGFLIFGANQSARLIASALQRTDIPVRLVDTNWDNLRLARMESLPVYFGNPVSEHAGNHLDLNGVGRVLLLSPYRQLNPVVAMHFQDWFGNNKVFGLAQSDHNMRAGNNGSGRMTSQVHQFIQPLGGDISYAKLASSIAQGAQIKTTTLSETFTYERYRQEYNGRALPLFLLNAKGRCQVWEASMQDLLQPDDRLIALIQPSDAKGSIAAERTDRASDAADSPAAI